MLVQIQNNFAYKRVSFLSEGIQVCSFHQHGCRSVSYKPAKSGGERGSVQSRRIPRSYIAHFRLSRVFATKPLTKQAMVGSLRNDEVTER